VAIPAAVRQRASVGARPDHRVLGAVPVRARPRGSAAWQRSSRRVVPNGRLQVGVVRAPAWSGDRL